MSTCPYVEAKGRHLYVPWNGTTVCHGCGARSTCNWNEHQFGYDLRVVLTTGVHFCMKCGLTVEVKVVA